MSEPVTRRTRRTSRWDSASSPLSPPPSLPKKPSYSIPRNHDEAPQELDFPGTMGTSPTSSPHTVCSSLYNVTMPVRRTSGDTATILNLSLPFNEDNDMNKSRSTVELIAKVLDDVDLLDDEDNEDNDLDTVRKAPPARLLRGTSI